MYFSLPLSTFCSAVDFSWDSLKHVEKVMSTTLIYAGQTETRLINRDTKGKSCPFQVVTLTLNMDIILQSWVFQRMTGLFKNGSLENPLSVT